jgi:hypothetical protein
MFDGPENRVIICETFYVVESAIVNVMGSYLASYYFRALLIKYYDCECRVIHSSTFPFH